MSSRAAAERAIELLELQLKELTGIRNATARDPSFKNWRQSTLTVMQRIWPGDNNRCERFRRTPFSPADPRSDARTVREWYSRGCQEAARVLTSFIDDIRANGVPDDSGSEVRSTQPAEFEDGFPTVDLPAGDLGAASSTADMTDNMLDEFTDALPNGSDPSSPLPQQLRMDVPPPGVPGAVVADPRPQKRGLNMKARLRDLLGFAQLSAKAIAGFPREMSDPASGHPPVADARAELGVVPVGDDVGPVRQAPPPVSSETAGTTPAWPTLQPRPAASTPVPPPAEPAAEPPASDADSYASPSMIMSRPTTLRTSIEKVTIASLISPEFRGATSDAPPPAEEASVLDPSWPVIGPSAPVTPADASAEVAPEPVPAPPTPSRAGPRPSLTLVRPVFNDPEFNVEPESGDEPAAKSTKPAPAPKRNATRAATPAAPPTPKLVPMPAPPSVPEPEDDAELGSTAAEPPPAKVDPEAFARATEDFMRSSPVLGATGRPVQRGFDEHEFADPDAIAVSSTVQELARMGVPAERQPELRARLMDLARRLESGTLEWTALRKSLWFAMEYPELARRIVPVLLPWIDRAA